MKCNADTNYESMTDNISELKEEIKKLKEQENSNKELQDIIDMMNDEFLRIRACLNSSEIYKSEIIGLVDRALQNIKRNCHIIDDVDNLKIENKKLINVIKLAINTEITNECEFREKMNCGTYVSCIECRVSSSLFPEHLKNKILGEK